MVKKKISIGDTMEEKLRYIGLDLNNLPKNVLQTYKLNFKVLKGLDEKQHKQYRYIDVKDIDILLTPTNRLNDLKDKYEKARPLSMYLDSKNKENIVRHTTFLGMLKKVEISKIKEIEQEQDFLSKKVPFRVKYNRNYLWQIYYSEYANRYFMLVPTEDTEYSTFFYLLKKKLENDGDSKIFVPVSYIDYSSKILKKSEIRDLENYLWLFTKDYPQIYEVYDKKDKASLQIVGESQIYGKIKTLYKINLETPKDAMKLYKLLKALFILQTELPHYFNFTTNIDSDGELNIYLNDVKIEYENLAEFVLEQYMKSISLKEKTQDDIDVLEKKLDSLKIESTQLESEYFEKEKQISTFLECKKSFFGKVKYYFKFGKKSSKHEKKESFEDDEDEEIKAFKGKDRKKFKLEERIYTLDELVISYKELEILENTQKNLVLDINALKLKNKNLKKKIENASSYIKEIDKHKKSIFEFWKYSNKDEVLALEEGEKEELSTTEIEKQFDYDEEFEKFGEKVDKNQRMKFTDSELDSSFIATTEVLELINKTYKKQVENKDFSEEIRILKESKNTNIDEEDDIDALKISDSDSTEEKIMGSKVHREKKRDKYEILDIRKGSRGLDLKKSVVSIIKDIKKAIKKNTTEEEMYIYKAMSDELDLKELQSFSLNEEQELKKYLIKNKLKRKNNLYRIKLPKESNFIGFSNIIFYDNRNMTLPVGMNESDKILVDLASMNLKEVNTKTIGKAYLEDNRNDFSRLIIKTIVVHEIEVVKE